EIVVHNGYGLEAGLARAAREHINGGMDICIVNEWKARHEALRADVVEVARRNGPTIADRMVADRLDGILDRDDERGDEARAAMSNLIDERDDARAKATEWEERWEALRDYVILHRGDSAADYEAAKRLEYILGRDDERGERD